MFIGVRLIDFQSFVNVLFYKSTFILTKKTYLNIKKGSINDIKKNNNCPCGIIPGF